MRYSDMVILAFRIGEEFTVKDVCERCGKDFHNENNRQAFRRVLKNLEKYGLLENTGKQLKVDGDLRRCLTIWRRV